MRARRGAGAPALALVAAVLAAAVPAVAAAQQRDSLAVRAQERLRRLARPPAPDTTTPYGERDTLVLPVRSGGGRGAPAVDAGGDSVVQALLGLEGYDATRYEGVSAEYDARAEVLLLRGDSASRALVRRGTMELTADSAIRYDEGRGRIRAEGAPLFTPAEGDPVESRVIVYDLAAERGSALSARTRYSSGANWVVTGDLPSVSPEVVYGDHVSFTSCELEVPHYHFETGEIKIVRGSILVARPVKLYFADVPVAWLPFIAQSTARGRSSGLLTPRFSVNDIVRTSGGYQRRISNVGFYWAMSDYTDATMAFDWFSDRYTSLTGAFRYRWLRKFLDGSIAYRQYWREEGGERAFDTNHSWEISERTRFRMSARYASSASFVRENSFDPREVTQSIQSNGGLEHRFDWGNLSLSANRQQYLSDDRVVQELPRLNLSISTITLFPAPSGRERWFNNMTWSASGNVRRQTTDRSPAEGEPFTFSTADEGTVAGGVSHSLSLGNLGLSQSVNYRENFTRAVPDTVGASELARAILGRTPAGGVLLDPEFADVYESTLDWSTSLNYQQNLIGSTTLTPRVSISGGALKDDDRPLARDAFVSEPTRISAGAELRSDIYGFWPGFGPYSALRHKISPSFSWSWSPRSEPTRLQTEVFGSRALLPTNELRLSVNQTFEVKREVEAPEEAEEGDGEETVGRPDSPGAAPGPGEPARQAPQAEIVNLLSLNTSAVTYDFVEADSAGDFLQGFQTTELRNQISSDLLRGLNLTVSHQLFDDRPREDAAPGDFPEREFVFHLKSMNLGFSLSDRSSIFRWLGLFGDDDGPEDPDLPEDEEPFADQRSATDETTIIPGQAESDPVAEDTPAGAARRSGGGGVGRWNANFSYSLQRPRDERLEESQMLQVSFRLKPTELWDLSWRTSYDVTGGAFNDHMISLTRDLHRWQATFNFQQTTTGNWTFRFEVSLLDNRDLKFDYEQRNIETRETRR